MKKKEVIALVAVVIIAVIMVSISSYAYFTAKVTGTAAANTVTSGTMAITYADGPEVSLDNAIPGDSVTKTFTVTNTGNVDSTYDIYLSEVNNQFADQTDLAYTLTSSDGGYSTTSDTQVPSAATKIVSSQTIATGVTHHYTLTIKFLAKNEVQNDNQGKKFSAKIQVNEYKEYGTNLATRILDVAGGTTAIAAKTAPTYTNNATTDEGMFATTDDYGTSYYYRGAVTNNNVLFGGFCWKVIRINGNGTTRMIYNGTPTNGTCVATGTATEIGTSAFNTNYNDNAYVGYMYGTAGSSTYEATHANTNSSTAKTAIDTWYNTNLASYASKISDTKFCNDRSIASTAKTWFSTDTAKGYGDNETFYGVYNRLLNTRVPLLTCQNKNDCFTVSDAINGNAVLTYPIGLITGDEVGFAGASMTSESTNSSYYLYTNSAYWTMSPLGINGFAAELNVGTGGNFSAVDVDNVYGIRPVINLKTDTLYTSGDGTSLSPYVVS